MQVLKYASTGSLYSELYGLWTRVHGCGVTERR